MLVFIFYFISQRSPTTILFRNCVCFDKILLLQCFYQCFNHFILSDFWFQLAGIVLQLPEGGDFEALHCQPSRNFNRSTKLDLTTEPPLLGRCCYLLALFVFKFFNCFFKVFVIYFIYVNSRSEER